MKLQALLVLICTAVMLSGTQSTLAQWREERIVLAANSVLQGVTGNPDSTIPQALLQEAQGLVIVPDVVKGGFVVGLRHGRGVVLVRDHNGQWQSPAFVSLTGGSIGWQIGLQATDVILVFRTQNSVRGLLDGKFTIGVDAAAAAGPVGRQAAAATDARLGAEIYSYSRSRGLFAGVSLDGSALQVDAASTQNYYQASNLAPGTVPLVPGTQYPASAARLLEQVSQLTGTQAPVGAPQRSERAVAPSPPRLPEMTPSIRPTPQQITNAWQRLAPLLDPSWKRYLKPPSPGDEATAADLQAARSALTRYDSVAQDPQYQTLTSREEFQTLHRLLRNYAQMQAEAIRLPPPPEAESSPETTDDS